MRVIATQTGFDGIQIRNKGDEFDVPDDSEKSTWFEPAKKRKPKPAEDPPPEGGSDTGSDA